MRPIAKSCFSLHFKKSKVKMHNFDLKFMSKLWIFTCPFINQRYFLTPIVKRYLNIIKNKNKNVYISLKQKLLIWWEVNKIKPKLLSFRIISGHNMKQIHRIPFYFFYHHDTSVMGRFVKISSDIKRISSKCT